MTYHPFPDPEQKPAPGHPHENNACSGYPLTYEERLDGSRPSTDVVVRITIDAHF